MAWESIKTTFILNKSQPIKKRKKKSKHKMNKLDISISNKTNLLNQTFPSIINPLNSSKSHNFETLYDSEDENYSDTENRLAHICTNESFNINPEDTTPDKSFSINKRKINLQKISLKRRKNNLFNQKSSKNFEIIEETSSSDHDTPKKVVIDYSRQIVEESPLKENGFNCERILVLEKIKKNAEVSKPGSSKQHNSSSFIKIHKVEETFSQKSDICPKPEDYTIESLSSNTQISNQNENTKIITQISNEDHQLEELEGEKELDLLIRDLQSFVEKEKRIKPIKGGHVEKMRQILKSNRSNYYFWQNDYENNLVTKEATQGKIIEMMDFFGQTLLTISNDTNSSVRILIDLNNKIYRDQSFSIGTKVLYFLEDKPLLLNNYPTYLGSNKIMEFKWQ